MVSLATWLSFTAWFRAYVIDSCSRNLNPLTGTLTVFPGKAFMHSMIPLKTLRINRLCQNINMFSNAQMNDHKLHLAGTLSLFIDYFILF